MAGEKEPGNDGDVSKDTHSRIISHSCKAYDDLWRWSNWRRSGPNSLTTFENVSVQIMRSSFSLRCGHELRLDEYMFDTPVATAFPRNSEALNVRRPASVRAIAI